MQFTPHEYQRTAISWLVTHPEAGLFLEPGLGKSAITLCALQSLMATKAVKKTLIVAPLRVAQLVWSRVGELGKWDQFRSLRVALLHGAGKEAALQADADLYVINFDGLKWLVESGGLLALTRRGVDTLVIDELSKMKHPATQRFRAIKPHLGRFRRRWGLTGTPVANGLLDLFGQCYTLDLGRSLGRYVSYYRSKYFTPTGYGGYTWSLKPDAERDIYTVIKPLALSMKAADCLGLPELVEREIYVELPDEARKAYDELHAELLTVIENETVTAANTAVALNKCRQVAGGALYVTPDHVLAPSLGADDVGRALRRVVTLHTAKVDALADLVDELQGQPLLVLYEFTHELERLRAKLGDFPAINGATKPSTLAGLVRDWNAGKVPLLAGHPAAMGHGLNLQGCAAHIASFTPTWDFELDDQAIRRVWRQGQVATRVILHRILARRTVDQAVMRALRGKSKGQAALFEALRAIVDPSIGVE